MLVGFVHPRLRPSEPRHGAQRTHLSDRESHSAAQPPGLNGAGPAQENRRQHLQQTGEISHLIYSDEWFAHEGLCVVEFHSESEEEDVSEERSAHVWSHV